MLQAVLNAFGINPNASSVEPFGSGLINHTWKVVNNDTAFILQRINTQVFKDPAAIAHNVSVAGLYFDEHFPDYTFVRSIKTTENNDLFFDEESGGYFRLTPFIKGSHTIDVVQKPKEAFEAARQFGKFTNLLSGLNANNLKVTLPDFHNLSLRYQQFTQALKSGNGARIEESRELINELEAHTVIVATFEEIKLNANFKQRVTHHDTKISNVLFDDNDNGICVIDLDTVMPGYFISDVGDMMRTYLCPYSEEEKNFSKISIRNDVFFAIVQGYLGELKNELTPDEQEHFVYAGKFMIYMQALRFLTDYLNNDVYYGSKYEGQNFVRAGNQLTLLKKLSEQEETLQHYVTSFLSTGVTPVQ